MSTTRIWGERPQSKKDTERKSSVGQRTKKRVLLLLEPVINVHSIDNMYGTCNIGED